MNIFLGNPPENIRQWIINDYNRRQEEKRKVPHHLLNTATPACSMAATT